LAKLILFIGVSGTEHHGRATGRSQGYRHVGGDKATNHIKSMHHVKYSKYIRRVMDFIGKSSTSV
jgi:hypothetical protein